MKKKNPTNGSHTRSSQGSRHKMPPDTPVLMIPNMPPPDELKEFVREAEHLLLHLPMRVILRFAGGSFMRPDAALAIHALLARRPAGTYLHADALSSVVGPAVILFLMADTREMRPSGYLFLPNPTRDQAVEGGIAHMLQDADAWKSEETGTPWLRKLAQLEMERVLEIVNQHVSAADLMDAPMDVESLSEYGLLGGCPWDSLLEKAAAGRVPKGGSAYQPDPRRGRRPGSKTTPE